MSRNVTVTVCARDPKTTQTLPKDIQCTWFSLLKQSVMKDVINERRNMARIHVFSNFSISYCLDLCDDDFYGPNALVLDEIIDRTKVTITYRVRNDEKAKLASSKAASKAYLPSSTVPRRVKTDRLRASKGRMTVPVPSMTAIVEEAEPEEEAPRASKISLNSISTTSTGSGISKFSVDSNSTNTSSGFSLDAKKKPKSALKAPSEKFKTNSRHVKKTTLIRFVDRPLVKEITPYPAEIAEASSSLSTAMEVARLLAERRAMELNGGKPIDHKKIRQEQQDAKRKERKRGFASDFGASSFNRKRQEDSFTSSDCVGLGVGHHVKLRRCFSPDLSANDDGIPFGYDPMFGLPICDFDRRVPHDTRPDAICSSSSDDSLFEEDDMDRPRSGKYNYPRSYAVFSSILEKSVPTAGRTRKEQAKDLKRSVDGPRASSGFFSWAAGGAAPATWSFKMWPSSLSSGRM